MKTLRFSLIMFLEIGDLLICQHQQLCRLALFEGCPLMVPVGISIIIRDTVYPLSLPPIWRVTKQHRQLSWRCEIRQSGGSRLAR